MKYDKISGFSDEIAGSLKAQIQGVKETGISYISIRNVNGKNICEYTPEDVKQQILPLLIGSGIKVSSIGSPLGKIQVDDEKEFRRQIVQAHNIAHIARILDCNFVRVFSFYLPEGDTPEKWRTVVFDKLKKFVDIFGSYGITVLHENEKEIYGDTAERCRELFENMHSPFFKGIFDFANFVQCNEETWRAYQILKKYIAYFHIKDALFKNKETVVCGQGDGEIKRILKDAFESGYQGFLTLEPHLVLFDGLGSLERKEADEIVKKNKAGSGLEAFRMQYSGLENILGEIINFSQLV